MRERQRLIPINDAGSASATVYKIRHYYIDGVRQWWGSTYWPPYTSIATPNPCYQFEIEHMEDDGTKLSKKVITKKVSHQKFSVKAKADYQTGSTPEVVVWSELRWEYGAYHLHETREHYEFEYDNTGYTRYGDYLNFVPPASHAPLDQSRLTSMIASIISDVTTLMPKASNFGVALLELGEIQSMKQQLQAMASSINTGTRKGLVHLLSGAHLAAVWGILPLVSTGFALATAQSDVIKRANQLMSRNGKESVIARRYRVTQPYSYDGYNGLTTTVHTVSCRGNFITSCADYDDLVTALMAAQMGLNRICRTLYAVLPFSFAVDAVISIPGKVVDEIDSELDKVMNLLGKRVYLPTRSDALAANWTLSSKSTTVVSCSRNLEPASDISFPMQWEEIHTAYDRDILDMSNITAPGVGMSPALGLAGSLGAVLISGRAAK